MLRTAVVSTAVHKIIIFSSLCRIIIVVLYEKGHVLMTRLLNRLKLRFGRYTIDNLMLVICIGQLIVFFADLLTRGWASDLLWLSWSDVTHGQIWRLVTFIFEPNTSSLLSLIITVYFYYFIGGTLENEWGSFNFNCYYLLGMICNIVASVFTGYGTSYYLNLTLFFAFSMLYPDFQLLFFYVIPLKAKWIALIDGLFYLYEFILYPGLRLNMLASLVPFILFFWDDMISAVRRWRFRMKNR